jgi:outer membrane protein TolC
VAAAVADQFPRISLSARVEASAAETKDLFDNWLASLGANLTAPLLDGGLRAAEVDRTRARAEEQLHAYGQSILDALREVEDALVEERQQERYLASLGRQVELSRQASDQTRDRYAKGAEDFLRVLTALQSYQSLQRRELQARRELIEFRIGLYRALGGGWDMEPPVPGRRTP